MSVAEIKSRLQQHGVKPSLPRIKIYEYLDTYRSHPTVDEIYSALAPELITLSKTTVYNTVDLFAEHRLVTQILIEDKEARYDARTDNHGHFKCTECGSVYDFDFDLADSEIPGLRDFEISEYHTYLKGICKQCRDTM